MLVEGRPRLTADHTDLSAGHARRSSYINIDLEYDLGEQIQATGIALRVTASHVAFAPSYSDEDLRREASAFHLPNDTVAIIGTVRMLPGTRVPYIDVASFDTQGSR